MTREELILAIAEYHPASEAGRKRDWSHYTGGMADTGDWYFRKLLAATTEQLQECLNELVEDHKPKPPIVYTEEEIRQRSLFRNIKNDKGEVVGVISQYQENQLRKFQNDCENRIWFGLNSPPENK